MRHALSLLSLLALVTIAPACAVARSGHPSMEEADGAVDARSGSTQDAAGAVETVSMTVTGAHGVSTTFMGPTNYVSCLGDSSGFVSFDAAIAAGGNPSLAVRLRDYHGPGTYAYTYVMAGSENPQVNARLAGGYDYGFFYDTDRTTFVERYSTCTLTVDAVPGLTNWVDATVSCQDLWAQILSPDYDEIVAGHRPSVSLSAHFRCELPIVGS